MTRHDIAKLACKLFAVWFFCQAFIGVYQGLVMVVTAFAASTGGGGSRFAAALVPCVLVVGYLLLGVLLWKLSGRIASGIVPPDDQRVTSRSLDGRTILGVGIGIIGVYFTMAALLLIGRYAYVIFDSKASFGAYWDDWRWRTDILEALAQLVVGLCLMFGARGLARMIRHYRAPHRARPAGDVATAATDTPAPDASATNAAQPPDAPPGDGPPPSP